MDERIRKMTYKEWTDEGTRLFGKDKKNWKFICPNCGNIQDYHDFEKLNVKNIQDVVFFSCIGRWIDDCKGEIGNHKSPCDYTNGGLFDFSKVRVLKDGKEISAFEFAAEVELDDDLTSQKEPEHNPEMCIPQGGVAA